MSAKSAAAKASIARAKARSTSERDKSTGKPAKLEQLAGLVGQADALGIDTTQARGMLAQDEAEGYKRYKGSTYEKSAKGGKRYEPTILSTVGGKAKFDSKIMPAVTKANEGIASLGVPDTTTDTTPREKTENAMLQAEYDATKTPEQLASDTYISSLTKESEAMTKAYDDMSKASARTARADISALKQQYRQRKAALEESNRTEYNQTQQSFIRSGQAEYSPTMTAGFLSAREREGQQRVAELNDQYLSKVDAINLALEEKEYANVASEVKAMKEIEEKIRTEVKGQVEEAKKENKRLLEIKNKRDFDTSVVNIMKSGVTDPLDVYAQMALDGTLGDYTLTDILGIAGKLDNIESLKPKKVKEEVTEYSDVPEGGIDITQGFNFAKAKTADYKKLARELFPSDFGNKLLVELTDEELIEFIKDYTDDVNAQQQNIEPEKYFMDWAEKSGAVKPKEETGFEAKLNKLFAE